MVYTTTPAVPTGAYIQATHRQLDHLGEPIVKAGLLYNAAGEYQAAMRVYEIISQAAITKATVSVQHAVTGQNTTAGNGGAFSKAGDVLILAFEREHPVASMAGTTITNEFVIVAPSPDLYDGDGNLIIDDTDDPTLATAASDPQMLYALIQWLEAALVVTVLKTRYPGGWTFSLAKSRLATLPKQYDGYSAS